MTASTLGPPWLNVARTVIGLKEHVGPGSNPVILQWVRDIGAPAWYDDDDKAWCALYCNRMLFAVGAPLSGTGFDLLRAKSFETWGEALEAPALGAVVVFTRAGGGHVGFYLGERADALRVLGGNQGNTVSEAWIPRERLSGIRWPAGWPRPALGPIWLEGAGAVSVNEA